MYKSNDFFFEVARGARKGMEGLVLCGLNADVDAAEDVWDVGGDVPAFNATGFLIEAVSADADDADADTGARTVLITGTDENGDLQTETITMNGTNAVAGLKTWGFINRAEVASAGSSLGNEGVITVRIAGAGATKCQIAAGHGVSDGAFYYVPNGYRFILEGVTFWATTAGTITIGVGRVRGGVYTFQTHVAVTSAVLQPASPVMVPYAGGDLVKVRVSAVSAGNQSVGAILRGVLMDSTAV